MTPAQKKLAVKHGTPAIYQRALWSAFKAGTMTLRQAAYENEKYVRQWIEAGQESRDLEAEIIDEEPPF